MINRSQSTVLATRPSDTDWIRAMMKLYAISCAWGVPILTARQWAFKGHDGIYGHVIVSCLSAVPYSEILSTTLLEKLPLLARMSRWLRRKKGGLALAVHGFKRHSKKPAQWHYMRLVLLSEVSHPLPFATDSWRQG